MTDVLVVPPGRSDEEKVIEINDIVQKRDITNVSKDSTTEDSTSFDIPTFQDLPPLFLVVPERLFSLWPCRENGD